MYVISEDCINTAVHRIISDVNSKGEVTKSDKGEVRELNRALVEIKYPTRRYLNLEGRNNNVFAMIAETMWVLSGTSDISPVLSAFLPRAADFSDDGKTWRGGYGPRLYKDNQLQSVLDRLTLSKATRHGVISIYDPSLDSDEAITSQLGHPKTKDLPCNNMLYFYTDATDRNSLNLHVVQRSGDAVWGMGSINIFEWTFLQEVIASMMGMSVGIYSHYVNNLHAYYDKPVVVAQIKNIVQAPVVPLSDMNMTPMELGTVKTSTDLQTLFKKLMGVLEMLVLGNKDSIEDARNAMWAMDGILEGYEIPRTGKLYTYMVLLIAYLRPMAKVDPIYMSPDLLEAVTVSKFRKFDLV